MHSRIAKYARHPERERVARRVRPRKREEVRLRTQLAEGEGLEFGGRSRSRAGIRARAGRVGHRGSVRPVEERVVDGRVWCGLERIGVGQCAGDLLRYGLRNMQMVP